MLEKEFSELATLASKRYVVKFGCRLLATRIVDDSAVSVREFPVLESDLREHWKATSHVLRVDDLPPASEDVAFVNLEGEPYQLFSMNPVKLSVQVPRKNQGPWASVSGPGSAVVEHFSLIYDGQIFMAFAEVSAETNTDNFGQVARDALMDLTPLQDPWESVSTWPNPFRVTINISLVDSPNIFEEFYDSEAEQYHVVLEQDDAFEEEFLPTLFADEKLGLQMLYVAISTRFQADRQLQAIYEAYHEMLEKRLEALTTRWPWEKWKRQREINILSAALNLRSLTITSWRRTWSTTTFT